MFELWKHKQWYLGHYEKNPHSHPLFFLQKPHMLSQGDFRYLLELMWCMLSVCPIFEQPLIM